jgi:hypothetical protein
MLPGSEPARIGIGPASRNLGQQTVWGFNTEAGVLGLQVDQTLIGKVARITVAVMRNVIATPIKIH